VPANGGFSRPREANEDDQNSLCRENIENAAKLIGAYTQWATYKHERGILESFTEQKNPLKLD